MKALLVLLLLIAGGYSAWDKLRPLTVEPLYPGAYVVVYGRDACGLTKRMRKELDREGVPYKYQSVDTDGVSDVLHERMANFGLETGSYMLPVVDVSGQLIVSPPPAQVREAYARNLETPRS